eukprot:288208-Pelagomonas_calceolata.AAC.10
MSEIVHLNNYWGLRRSKLGTCTPAGRFQAPALFKGGLKAGTWGLGDGDIGLILYQALRGPCLA